MKRNVLLLREGFGDEPIGLGAEAIVGLQIEENELSWSLGRGGLKNGLLRTRLGSC